MLVPHLVQKYKFHEHIFLAIQLKEVTGAARVGYSNGWK
jgi:hypothetical protein